MSYKINFENYRENFSIPVIISENNFKEINGDYLKVILLIFKNSDKEYSNNLISKLTGLSEATVKDAIEYWISKGVLKSDSSSNRTKQQIQPNIVVGDVIKPATKPMVDSEFKFLIDSAQKILSRVMTSTDIQILKYIYQDYRLPIDVILMVIEYCVKQGITGIKFIENECMIWYNNGITNSVQAEEFLLNKEKQVVFEKQVKDIFKKGDISFKANEQICIDRWYNDFRYGKDIILLAYEKALPYVKTPTISYINTILCNWNQKGFRTVTDIVGSENIGNNKLNFAEDTLNKSYSFDIDEYEKQLRKTPRLD